MSFYSLTRLAALISGCQVLAFLLSPSPATPGPRDTGSTCNGAVTTLRGSGSTLECNSACSSGCTCETAQTSIGQGCVCACSEGGWDGCCTIAIVPPGSQGVGWPVGDCGGGCPDGADCGAILIWRPFASPPTSGAAASCMGE